MGEIWGGVGERSEIVAMYVSALGRCRGDVGRYGGVAGDG